MSSNVSEVVWQHMPRHTSKLKLSCICCSSWRSIGWLGGIWERMKRSYREDMVRNCGLKRSEDSIPRIELFVTSLVRILV